jgi:hypothetical protein
MFDRMISALNKLLGRTMNWCELDYNPSNYVISFLESRKIMDTLVNLEAFLATADTGGFSAAARKLNVATSVVAKRVTQLEDRIGAVPPFHTSIAADRGRPAICPPRPQRRRRCRRTVVADGREGSRPY